MKRRLLVLGILSLALLVAVVLLAAACAPKPAAPEAPKLTYIEIQGGMFGSVSYEGCYGLMSIINKHSDWLRASLVETAGSPAGIKAVTESPTNRICNLPDFTSWGAVNGLEPFDRKYPELRNIAFFAATGPGFVTWDPNIKSIKDFAGKTIVLGPAGTALGLPTTWMLEAEGVADGARILNTKWGGIKDNYIDGIADVGLLSFTGGIGAPWGIVPVNIEMMAARPFYCISIPEETFKKASEAQDYPLAPRRVPADGYKSGVPQTDINVLMDDLAYGCTEELPDEIAYEIARIAYDYMDDLKVYAPSIGAGISKELLSAVFYPWQEDYVHPGALKFYNERGIEMKAK
jgi:TRAP transporter TAXI family solute receptor